ncbi:SpoIIE family protein phosphatase [Streptomyces sp. B6B3]|uniref:SpoIIE family protein phosphatase n=1 Tax=Streptomyces sp. B6B3 TaxID=3153570 RepID=UPI00325DF80E
MSDSQPSADPKGFRLRLIAEASDLPGEVELLRLGLQQAVSAVGALGGLAHLARPREDALRLAAATGLPTTLVRPYDQLARDDPAAPARAVRERDAVWSTARPAGASDALAGWEGVGVLSVPIRSGEEVVGVLSVLAEAAPDQRWQEFLGELCRLLGERLEHVREPRSGVPPWWQEPSGAEWRQAMRSLSVAAWSWDLATGLLTIDELGGELVKHVLGVDPDEWDHRIESWMARIHPDDRAGVEAEIERSLATGDTFAVEYRVRALDGRLSWLELRAHTTYTEDGTPLTMAGTAWDVTTRRGMLEWLRGVLEDLPDPFYVVGPDDRVLYANREGLRITAEEGSEIGGRVLWETAPFLAETGLRERFAEARAATGPTTFKLRMTRRGGEAYYRIRLVPVSSYLAGQMVDITEQERAERAAADRARQISALTTALAQSLAAGDVVDAVAEHVLPSFGASGLVVHSLLGGRSRLVGSAGYSTTFLRQLRELGDSEQLSVPTRREPQFVGSPGEHHRRWPQLAPLVEASGKQAWAILPLMASGRHVGSCVISWDEPREFGRDERGLLLTLAALIGQALERARLFDDTQGRAQRLQRALLPGALPSLPGVSAAARYRPASGGDQVGGDWYDAIPLPGGRVTMVVGDVMGHGLDQAITMGILRNAVLTLATLDMAVEELMAHLNDVVTRLGRDNDGTAVYTTCLVAVYDPTTGRCDLASAGHPPPALVRPGRPPEFLNRIPQGPPLGVAQLPVETSVVELEEGSLLVLYTDGLLGSDDPDAGAARLGGILDRAAASPPALAAPPERQTAWLESLCDTITDSLRPDPRGPQDDAALLTVRTRRIPADHIASWDLPYAPQSAGRARELCGAQLADWDLRALTDSTELIVSELIGNTIRHAVGPIRLRLLLLDGVLTTEVYDGSEATPHVRHPSFEDEFGRGLQMVALVATEWGARYTEAGKCIWADQAVPGLNPPAPAGRQPASAAR